MKTKTLVMFFILFSTFVFSVSKSAEKEKSRSIQSSSIRNSHMIEMAMNAGF